MSYNKSLHVCFNFFSIIACACILFSCKVSKNTTKEDFLYFQRGLDSIKNVQVKEPIIHVNDLLSIQVSSASLNQEQTIPFNPPGNAGYLVSTTGNIEMPVLGTLKAAGLTQAQLQSSILEKLSNYVKDPNVIVHFLQFKINVLGEVKSPGEKKFDVDRVTIIDAISAAGDLTDIGKREDVTVIREEGTSRKIYRVDLRSGSLFQSPVYNMQSNDILYVGANAQKFKQLKGANSNNALNGLRIVGTVLGLFTSIILAIRVFNN